MKAIPPMLLAATLLCCATASVAAAPKVRVAFVISNDFNVMDFAGPWEVFQDVMLGGTGADMDMPYELYTVASTKQPVKSFGGALVTPQYSLADAPRPDLVVVGAQTDSSEPLLAWLRAQHATRVTIMSVCTGASKLARAGLLDGRQATTHHEYLGDFRRTFPKVQWLESRRYVRADEGVYTAGGLSSGIDLALHLVATRFGPEVAQRTADYMEYHGDGWKQPE